VGGAASARRGRAHGRRGRRTRFVDRSRIDVECEAVEARVVRQPEEPRRHQSDVVDADRVRPPRDGRAALLPRAEGAARDFRRRGRPGCRSAQRFRPAPADTRMSESRGSVSLFTSASSFFVILPIVGASARSTWRAACGARSRGRSA
jgi:hypothetical protein